jgi:ribosome-binding factor A
VPREFHRSQRVAQSIHRSLSELLRDDVRDARLRDVTLTHVDLTRDLSVAKVYYTVRDLDDDEAAKAFASAAGFLRRELARQIRLRVMPELRFIRDESIERGESLSALIDAVRARDIASGADDDLDGEADSARDDGDSSAARPE